jgi:hypothetical protein
MASNHKDRKLAIWDAFCREHRILECSVPLFAADGSAVTVRPLGIGGRPVLARSPEMEALVIAETNKVLADFASGAGEYEGLIYMMQWSVDGRAVPLYVSKSEKYGRGGGNLSANIASIERNRHKFCRWGDGYAYHIGDLSAVACLGHPPEAINAKYRKWADRLFESWPSAELRLRRDTRFWVEAWRKGGAGPWREYGDTSLTFLEYQLIGVASDLFPEVLLNTEGVNRV